MTPADVARLLAKCAAFDQRTVGQADVMAWHEILAPYDLADALEAVTRHYRDSAERIMPAQLRRLTLAVRDERHRHLAGRDGVRALPSRYEPDIARDVRVREGIATCREVLRPLMERLAAANDRLKRARLDEQGASDA